MISGESNPELSGRGADYLTFFIAGEEYAVTLEKVREVIPYDTVTRVPGMPAPVRGVTNLRGNVVPVIDLAIKFRLPEIPVNARACIVLVEMPLDGTPILMGLLTEAVGQVLTLGPGDLLPAPAFGAPIRTDFLQGMAQVGKKFAMVLDIDRVLSPAELAALNAGPEGERVAEANPQPQLPANDLDATWESVSEVAPPKEASSEANGP